MGGSGKSSCAGGTASLCAVEERGETSPKFSPSGSREETVGVRGLPSAGVLPGNKGSHVFGEFPGDMARAADESSLGESDEDASEISDDPSSARCGVGALRGGGGGGGGGATAAAAAGASPEDKAAASA